MSLTGYLIPRNEREYVNEKDREKSLEERLRFLAERVRPAFPDAEECDPVLRAHCRL